MVANQKSLIPDENTTDTRDDSLPRLVTSNFASLKKIRAAGYEPVAISIGIPGWFKGRNIPDLAPTRAMLKMDWEDYDPLYFAILDRLEPDEVLDRLLATPDGLVAMLCWCRANECCHRRYVAEWLEIHLEIQVPELGHARQCTPTFLDWE